MRLFLAVFPPPAVQRAAHALGEALRRANGGVSWVKPENLHYTMRFLGEVGEDGARRAGEAAREAVAGRAAFDATLGGLGAFPDARRARVIWLGMTDGADALVEVAKALEAALRKREFDRADKPFSAHLTLGRVRTPGDWTAAFATAAGTNASADNGALHFRVDRLSVVESQLSPKGSIYTLREASTLGE